jgi:hypothetical protein
MVYTSLNQQQPLFPVEFPPWFPFVMFNGIVLSFLLTAYPVLAFDISAINVNFTLTNLSESLVEQLGASDSWLSVDNVISIGKLWCLIKSYDSILSSVYFVA